MRQARGLYTATRHQLSAEHSLAQVAKRVPAGVFCLLTALRFHELTTQSPADVWIDRPWKNRTSWRVSSAAKSSLPGRRFCREEEAVFG